MDLLGSAAPAPYHRAKRHAQHKFLNHKGAHTDIGTVVAEMITELICFEPEICICNGN